MVLEARETFGSKIFSKIFITGCWIIWLTRNGVIFNNGQVSITAWKIRFKEEFGYVCTKAKVSRQNQLNIWRDSYV